jgi:hypothetical protein
MAGFNGATVTVAKGQGVIKNTPVVTRNHQGGFGATRSSKSELFLLGVSSFNENAFYESADARLVRMRALVKTVVLEDQEWIQNFVFWLRHTANMRSITLAIALEAAKALKDANVAGGRGIVSAAMARADEPAEAIAYWHAQFGRKLPQSVKRGIADAATALYSANSVFKYDSSGDAIRFADVIQLTHPEPKDAFQSSVFKFALDRRYDSKAVAPFERKLTWENKSSEGVMDAKAWESVIPEMGYMALLRNLRNFIQAGVSRKVLDAVAQKIADPDEVARSRQLPFRFYSAYKAVEGNNIFKLALDDGFNAACSNVPSLKGKNLLLVDVSGSMTWERSEKTDSTAAEAASLFAGVLASRAENVDLYAFDSQTTLVNFKKGASALEIMKAIPQRGGGTYLMNSINQTYKTGYDRVIVLTDEQHNGGRVFATIPKNVPVFVWNLAGYSVGASQGESNVYTSGGLSDASFGYIEMIESSVNEDWPWS